MGAPVVGYLGKISKGGTSTAFTGGGCALVSGQTYQLTSAAQRRLDPASPITVKDNGVVVAAADIASIDCLSGR